MKNPQLPPRIHIEQVAEKGGKPVFFVLDPDQPSWVFLNQDGMEILNQCDGKHSPQKIAEEIAAEHQSFSAGEVLPVVNSFLESMRKSKIIDQSPSSRTENTFRGIALEITQKCNLRCKHCYLSAGKEAETELSTQEIKQLLQTLKEIGGVSVAFGGGEALMREDCLELMQYAVSLDLLISLGTNGTLIDRSLAKALAQLPLKIQISLDGATPATHNYLRGKGSFEKTVRGIDYLIEEGMAKDLVIAFTPMRPNIDEVPLIVDFALYREIPVVQFPPLTSAGRAQIRWPKLKLSPEEKLWFWEYISRRAKELTGKMDLLADCFSLNIHQSGVPHQCTIGTQFRIDPNGNVYPCQCFHFGNQFSLGNLREKGLDEMVYGQKIKRIKALSFKRPQLIPQCHNCLWHNICGGGCMGNAYENTGRALNPVSCSVRKKWVEKLFEVELEGVLANGL
jgi:radical SAM protein with 4Fe4S-binding SPASM domain